MKMNNQVPAVRKALDILEYVGERRNGATVMELAAALKIPQASAFRLVATLAARGYIRRRADGSLRFGPRSAALADAAISASDLREAAGPFTERLLRRCGKTVELTSYEDGEITFVDVLESDEPVRFTRRIGAPLIGSTNPITLVVLAGVGDDERRQALERMGILRESHIRINPAMEKFHFSRKWNGEELVRIARYGYCADYGRQAAGITRICAPVFGVARRIAGTLGVAGLQSNMQKGRCGDIIDEVKTLASELSRELGWAANIGR
jgi:DNA-binding IclR family transcriptional regulator